MRRESFKKTAIVFMLGLLTASAFFVRLENFRDSRAHSVDEIVYYRMARQVIDEGPSGYHTIPYGRELAATGRPLPEYFFQPLFKHPPLFTFMAAAALKIFGRNLASVGYLSLLFGALLIPLTYLLGTLLFDRRIGICSALFMWLDPVSVMTSQKAWMDTALAFFMLAAVYFFVMGWKSGKGTFFIWSGLACGLAVLTKYTGILAMLTIGVFAFVYRRDLFRSKAFVTSLALPFAVLLPWFYWNYLVYGSRFGFVQQSLHKNEQMYRGLAFLILSVIIVFGLFRLIYKMKEKFSVDTRGLEKIAGGFSRENVDYVLGIVLGVIVIKHVILGLQFNHVPRTSWAGATFKFEPPTFYVAQLLEYSFIYFFAFVSFFIGRRKNLAEISLLRYGTLVTVVFFTLWKSFQCRYILFAIPFLTILAFELIFMISERLSRVKSFLPRLFLKGSLVLLITYSVGRTFFVDVLLSFPNDMCYF